MYKKIKLLSSLFLATFVGIGIYTSTISIEKNNASDTKEQYIKSSNSDPANGYYVNSLFDEYSYRNLKQEEESRTFTYKVDGKENSGTDYWSMHSQFFYKGKEAQTSLYKEDSTTGEAASNSAIFDVVDKNGNIKEKATVINDLTPTESVYKITNPGLYVLNGDLRGAINVELPVDSEGTVVIDLNGFRVINTAPRATYAISFYNKNPYTGNKQPYFYLLNSYDEKKFENNPVQKELHTSTFYFDNGQYKFLDLGQILPEGYQKVNETDDREDNDYYAEKTYFEVEGGVVTSLNTPWAGIKFVYNVNNKDRQDELFTFAGLNVAGNKMTDTDILDNNGKAIANYGAGGIYLASVQNNNGQYKPGEDSKYMNSYGNIMNCNIVGNLGHDTGTAGGLTAGGINSSMFFNLVNSIVNANRSSVGGGVVLYKYANIANSDLSYNWADENIYPNKYENYAGYGGAIFTADYYVNFLGEYYNGTVNVENPYIPYATNVETYDAIIDRCNISGNKAKLGGGIFWQGYYISQVTSNDAASTSQIPYFSDKTFTLKDSTIHNNLSYSGSAIYIGEYSKFPTVKLNYTLTDDPFYCTVNIRGENVVFDNKTDPSVFTINNKDVYWWEGSTMNEEGTITYSKNRLDFNFDGSLIMYNNKDSNNVAIDGIFKDLTTMGGPTTDINEKNVFMPTVRLSGDLSTSSFSLDAPMRILQGYMDGRYLRNTDVDSFNKVMNKNITGQDGGKRTRIQVCKGNNADYCPVGQTSHQVLKAGYNLQSNKIEATSTYNGVEQLLPKPNSLYLAYRYSKEKTEVSINDGDITANYSYYIPTKDDPEDLDVLEDLIYKYPERYKFTDSIGFTQAGTYNYLVKISANKNQSFFDKYHVSSSNDHDGKNMDPRYAEGDNYFGLVQGTFTIEKADINSSDFEQIKEVTYSGSEQSVDLEYSPNSTIPLADRDKFYEQKVNVRYFAYVNSSYQVLDFKPSNATLSNRRYFVGFELKDELNYSFGNQKDIIEVNGTKYLNLGELVIKQISISQDDFSFETTYTYNGELQKPEVQVKDTSDIASNEKDNFLDNKCNVIFANKVNNQFNILQNGIKDASIIGNDYYLLLQLTDLMQNYKYDVNATIVNINGIDYLQLSAIQMNQVGLSRSDFLFDSSLTYNALEQSGNIRLSDITKVVDSDKETIFTDVGSVFYSQDNKILNSYPKNVGTYKVLYTLGDKSNYNYLADTIEIEGITYLDLGDLVINQKEVNQTDFSKFESVTYNSKGQSPDVNLSTNTSIPQIDQDIFLNSLSEVKYVVKKQDKWTFVPSNSFVNATNESNRYYVLVYIDDNSNYTYKNNQDILALEGKLYLNIGEYVINKLKVTPLKEWLVDKTYRIEEENKNPILNTSLPDGVSYKFIITDEQGKEVDSIEDLGTYKVYVKFIYDENNIEVTNSLEATYTVMNIVINFFPWLLILLVTLSFIAFIVLIICLLDKKAKRRFIKFN